MAQRDTKRTIQKGDALRLKIVEILNREGAMSLSRLERAAKVGWYPTVRAAVNFLEAFGIVAVKDANDALGTKLVSLTKAGTILRPRK